MSIDPTTVTKENLIGLIKQWMQIDTELKELAKEAKIRRDKKKILSSNLVDIMKSNEIECFDINNGKLLFTQNKVKGTLNKEYLFSIISKYFEKDKSVNPEIVTKFILDNRDIKIKEGIRCKFNKN